MARDFAKTFYKSSAWQEMRLYILKRDKYLCQDCLCAAAEEVHHIIWLTPDNIGNAEIALGESNLVSLCYKCHKARHERARKEILKTSEYAFDADGNIIPPEG